MSESKSEPFKLRNLSVLEQKYLKKARKEKKKKLVKKQVCLGKVFKGDAFQTTPKEIIFSDFQPGRKYKKTVILTNISYTFNSFKILPLRDEYQEFFKVEYKLPGRMSAGTTCKLVITFMPKKNVDVVTNFLLWSETGKIKVPLKCFTKRVDIAVSPKDLKVDFGKVMISESKKLTITITNTGALDTKFVCCGKLVDEYLREKEVAPQVEENPSENVVENEVEGEGEKAVTTTVIQEQHKNFQISKFGGVVRKRSSTTIDISFSPIIPVEIVSDLVLRFDDREISLSINACGTPVWIYIPDDVIDFKWVYSGSLYREKLLIFNRGKNAMKVQFRVPKKLKKQIEFHPNLAFIQPEKPFELQVKLRPSDNILKTSKEYWVGDREFFIPLKLTIPTQKKPVLFNVKFKVCSSNLTIQPRIINFGKCSIHECVCCQIFVKNNSFLTQKFGFINIPKNVQVVPNQGFFTILPQETIKLGVVFSPKVEREYNFKLIGKTKRNEEFLIASTAVGFTPKLRLSHSVIRFNPLTIGDSSEKALQIFNDEIHNDRVDVVGKKTYFQFFLPPNSGLRIFPKTGLLRSRVKGQKPSSMGLYLSFSPPLATSRFSKLTRKFKEKKVTPKKKKIPSSKLSEKEFKIEDIEADNYRYWDGERGGGSYRFKKFIIQCFVLHEDLPQLEVINLSVETSVLLSKELVIVDEKNEFTQVVVFRFSETEMLKEQKKTVLIKNFGEDVFDLDIERLEYSAFRIRKSPRPPLKSGEMCQIVISFVPTEKKNYITKLRISSQRSNCILTLVGDCRVLADD